MSTYEQKWWKFLAESKNSATEEQEKKIARLMGDKEFEENRILGFEMAKVLLTEYIARAKEMALFGYERKLFHNLGLVEELLSLFIDTNWDGPAFDKLKDDEKTPENLAKYLGVSVEAVDMMNTFRSKVQSVTNVDELKEAIDYFYLVSQKLEEEEGGVRINDEIFAPKSDVGRPYVSVPLKELFIENEYGYTNFDFYWVKRYLSKILEQEQPEAYHQNEDIPF